MSCVERISAIFCCISIGGKGISTKYIVKSTQYDNSYKTPVLTAGQSFILGYTNETYGVYKADIKNPVIIFDDFTTGFHWVDFDFKVKSSAMKMLKPKDNICFKYIFYAMSCIEFQATSHKRHWISIYSQFEIPFPPIEIQQKIAEILSTQDKVIIFQLFIFNIIWTKFFY